MPSRYSADSLRTFASNLLQAAGLASDRADTVAEILIEGDLLGHTTHGLQMLHPYLKSIEKGEMALEGEPTVLADHGACLNWDGNRLPGPWLVVEAVKAARARVAEYGVVTLTMRRSHHLACLQAYLKQVTDQNLMILLLSSDPSVSTVAPHGGIRPLYTPNPLAVGIPTDADPILMDISMSITTNGLTMRTRKQGQRMPGRWLKDAQGNITDDPEGLFTDPPGSLLPLGGEDHGHKGFALGILLEALTAALSGFGRSDQPTTWGAAVFLQLIDPSRFGGTAPFLRETGWLAEACRQTPVKPGDPPVRMPGQRGLERRREQLKHGIDLYPGILDPLNNWAEQFDVLLPQPK